MTLLDPWSEADIVGFIFISILVRVVPVSLIVDAIFYVCVNLTECLRGTCTRNEFYDSKYMVVYYPELS